MPANDPVNGLIAAPGAAPLSALGAKPGTNPGNPGAGAALYETHLHTVLCKHAEGTVGDYAAAAERRGMAGIIVTCHNPLPYGYNFAVRMSAEEFPRYLVMVEEARRAWEGRVDVRLGLECDYVRGLEDYLAGQTQWAKFDYLLGSIHPQTGEFIAMHGGIGYPDLAVNYFAQLARAAETRLFDCLAHPDIVKIMSPKEWRIKKMMPTIRRALDRIAATGMAMELNTSGVLKDYPEMNPGPQMLREMRLRGIAVVVGADAHVPQRVGDGYAAAYDLLEAAGYQTVSYFLQRKRYDLPIAAARKLLKP